MKKLLLILLILLSPLVSANAKVSERTASIACAIISETTLNQSAYRVKEVNEARSKLNLDPYLQGDAEILLSIKYDLCNLLIMDFDKYKDKIEILVLAEKKEIKRRREEREQAQEKLRRELEETERKEKEEREREYERKKEERINKLVQGYLAEHEKLKTALKNCRLPSDSSKISLKKLTETLSFIIFMEFSEDVSASCPSLISTDYLITTDDPDKKKVKARNDDWRAYGGDEFSTSNYYPKDVENSSSVLFWFEAKIDGFDDIVPLNSSYRNVFPVFNIEYSHFKSDFFRTRLVEGSLGIDASIDFGNFPYNNTWNENIGKWDFPPFTTKGNLKNLKVKMIREIYMVAHVLALERVAEEIENFEEFSKPIKKVIYVRDTK